jgi:hypothetical protein
MNLRREVAAKVVSARALWHESLMSQLASRNCRRSAMITRQGQREHQGLRQFVLIVAIALAA